MEKIKELLIKNLLLIVILLVTSFLHFRALDSVPPGMSHDEVVYALSAKTFQIEGVDISGTSLPMGLFRTETEGNISMLPLIFLSPFYYIFDIGQETARLPYVFFIYLSGFAVYLIAKNLFKDEKIGIIALFLFLMAPWSFFLARFAAEPPVALMFYLWGIASLFYFKKRKLLISFLIFILAFFSYHGGKILFIPLIIVCLVYFYFQKRVNKKESLLFLTSSVLVFAAFVMISFSLPGGIAGERKDEIFFLNLDFLSEAVNKRREITLENYLTPIFVNKATMSAEIFFQKYITAFSPKLLFLEGDTRLAYAFFYHGLLYRFDSIFIIVGAGFLFYKRRKEGLFLLGLLLIAPLPSAVNGVKDSYVNRSFMMILPLILFSSYGVYYAYNLLSHKINRIVVFTLLFICMSFFISNFLFFYFFQYPTAAGDSFALGEKVVSEFVNRSAKNGRKNIVVKNEIGDLYLETVFFSRDEKSYRSLIENTAYFDENVYFLKNIEFRGDCPVDYNDNTVYVLEEIKQCQTPFSSKQYIKSPRDAGIIYTIYNADLCDDYSLNSWNRHHYVSDYATDQMDDKTFCERWISI